MGWDVIKHRPNHVKSRWEHNNYRGFTSVLSVHSVILWVTFFQCCTFTWNRTLFVPMYQCSFVASNAFHYLTSSKKISIHFKALSAVRVPTQGAWKVWLKDVVVMSTEVGFMKRKGTHSHWGETDTPLTHRSRACFYSPPLLSHTAVQQTLKPPILHTRCSLIITWSTTQSVKTVVHHLQLW